MTDKEEEIDEAELQFEELMLSCDVTTLKEFCDGLGLQKDTWENKKKSVLLKTLRKSMDREEEETDEIRLDRVKKTIMALKVEIDKKDTEKKEDDVNQKITTDEKDVDMEKKNMLPELLLAASSASILRRDFRVIGQIGDKTQKDKLSFVSLMRQIEEGTGKGYRESEIVAGVLKAITPRNLRSYLELIKDLNISKLCEVLRVHYQEKSATELYQELIAMKQEKDEEASQFLIRALDTREKIVFTAKEIGGVKYEEEMVQGLFVKTIESGLQEDIVNNRIE